MKPEFIDVHAHLNFAAFDADREMTIKRALDAGVWMINVGTQQDTSRKAIELAEKYQKGVYAIVGLHPIHSGKSYHDEKELGEGGKEFISRGETFDSRIYHTMALHPKVVAIGECGLDYYRLTPETKKKQEENFIKQIALANEVGRPLMLHVRQAYKDAYEILKAHAKVPANLHFFAGTWEEAKLFLALGYTFSFTGVITFARDYDEVIKNLPLDRIMSETDCPYITPVPFRGKRNEPLYVQEVAKAISAIRNEPLNQVQRQLVLSAVKFFHLQHDF